MRPSNVTLARTRHALCPDRPSLRAYRPRAAIVHAGDAADAVVRIERGLVKLVARTPAGYDRIVVVLGPGDRLGVPEAVGGWRHGLDAIALTDVVVARTEREAFRRLLADDAEAALAQLGALGSGLRCAWGDLAASYLPVAARLARTLVDLTSRFGEPAPGGRRLLRCGMSHHALAEFVGAQRPSVSAAMAAYRAAGAAAGSRGTYLIDPDALAAFAPASYPAMDDAPLPVPPEVRPARSSAPSAFTAYAHPWPMPVTGTRHP